MRKLLKILWLPIVVAVLALAAGLGSASPGTGRADHSENGISKKNPPQCIEKQTVDTPTVLTDDAVIVQTENDAKNLKEELVMSIAPGARLHPALTTHKTRSPPMPR